MFFHFISLIFGGCFVCIVFNVSFERMPPNDKANGRRTIVAHRWGNPSKAPLTPSTATSRPYCSTYYNISFLSFSFGGLSIWSYQSSRPTRPTAPPPLSPRPPPPRLPHPSPTISHSRKRASWWKSCLRLRPRIVDFNLFIFLLILILLSLVFVIQLLAHLHLLRLVLLLVQGLFLVLHHQEQVVIHQLVILQLGGHLLVLLQ